MSRIFEALQRSESERSGVATAPPALATELLQAVEREASASAPKDLPANELAPHDVTENEYAENDFADNDFANNDLSQFQSLPVSLPQDSKLICLTAQESFGAEKFRFLGVRLRQLQHSRPLKKLLITSTIPEEGQEYSVRKPGNYFSPEATAENFAAGWRSAASIVKQAVWPGKASRVSANGYSASPALLRASTASKAPTCGFCRLATPRRIPSN